MRLRDSLDPQLAILSQAILSQLPRTGVFLELSSLTITWIMFFFKQICFLVMISFSSNNPRVVWRNPYFTDGKLEPGNRKIAQEDKSRTRTRMEIANIGSSRCQNYISRGVLLVTDLGSSLNEKKPRNIRKKLRRYNEPTDYSQIQ